MEPIAIATLAFIGTKVGETLVEKFTEAVLPKANALRKKIWDQLRGNPNAEIALQAAENGNQADLEAVAAYLNVAMLDDPNFAEEVQKLAEEIEKGKIPENDSMTMNLRDNARGIQKVENQILSMPDTSIKCLKLVSGAITRTDISN